MNGTCGRMTPLAVIVFSLICGVSTDRLLSESEPVIEPVLRLQHDAAADQDDLCFWRDEEEPSRSLVITSDKKANLLAVYDLEGRLLQTLPLPKPGNIDLRQHVRCGEVTRDVIAVNVRADAGTLALLEVDRRSRRLRRLDDGSLVTGPNYGLSLACHPASEKLYAILTSNSGLIRQFEVDGISSERPALKLVREWMIGKAEGAVADDASGRLYISEEQRGVWELNTDPTMPAPGRLVVRLEEDGLQPDLEGVALAGDWLLLSSQSQNRFFVYDRRAEFRFVGSFSVNGAGKTDGIDVLSQPCGDQFPSGVFGCHSAGTKPCAVLLTSWDRITAQLQQ